MTKFTTALGVAALMGASSLFGAGQALAGDCYSSVRGLSNTYNLAKGSGFLAIRSRPTSRSRMVGQAFNGNEVQIMNRSGRWRFVYHPASNKQGWVHGRYVRTTC